MANIPYRQRRPNNQGTFDVLWPETSIDQVIFNDQRSLGEVIEIFDDHINSKLTHYYRGVSTGNGWSLVATLTDFALEDGVVLLLKLNVPIEDNATLSVNGGDPYPIKTSTGQSISAGPVAGATLLLVWDATEMKWVTVNYTNPNKIITSINVAVGDTTVFNVTNFNRETDALISLNFGQTVLRETIDYVLNGVNTVTLLNSFIMRDGEQVVSTILKNAL